MKTKWMLTLGALMIIGGAFFFAINYRNLPPQIPLFYSLPWGESQLIPKLWFGLGLVVLSVIVLFNYLLTRLLKKNDPVVATVMTGATLLLISVYLATFFRILLLMI